MGGRTNASKQDTIPKNNARAPVGGSRVPLRDMLVNKQQYFGPEMTEHHHTLEQGLKIPKVQHKQISGEAFNNRDITSGF